MGLCSCKSISQLRKKKNPRGGDKDDYGEIYFPAPSLKPDASHRHIHIPTEVSVNESPSEVPYYHSPNRKGSQRDRSSDTSISFINQRSKTGNVYLSPLGNSKHPYQRKITDIYINQNEDCLPPYDFQNLSLADETSKIKVESISDKSSSTNLYSASFDNLTSLHSAYEKENRDDMHVNGTPPQNKAQNPSSMGPRCASKGSPRPVQATSPHDSPSGKETASLLDVARDYSAFRTPIEDFSSDVSDFYTTNRPRGYAYYSNPKPSPAQRAPPRSGGLALPPAPLSAKFSRTSSLTAVDVRNNRRYDPPALRRTDSFASGASEPNAGANRSFFSCRSTATSISAGQASGARRAALSRPPSSPPARAPSTMRLPPRARRVPPRILLSLEKPGGGRGTSAGGAKPTETQTGEAKPTETQTEEGKPTETQTGEAKPTETQTGEAKPTETQTEEGKPTETQTEEGKPAEVVFVTASLQEMRDVGAIGGAEGTERAASVVPSSFFDETPRSSCFRSFPPTPSVWVSDGAATPMDRPASAAAQKLRLHAFHTPVVPLQHMERSKGREATAPAPTPVKEPKEDNERKKEESIDPTLRAKSASTTHINPATMEAFETEKPREVLVLKENITNTNNNEKAKYETEEVEKEPLPVGGVLKGLRTSSPIPVASEGREMSLTSTGEAKLSTMASSLLKGHNQEQNLKGHALSSGIVIPIHDSSEDSLDRRNDSLNDNSLVDLVNIISY